MLVRESRTNSANGAFGRQDRAWPGARSKRRLDAPTGRREGSRGPAVLEDVGKRM
jgi:hypothetical protein